MALVIIGCIWKLGINGDQKGRNCHITSMKAIISSAKTKKSYSHIDCHVKPIVEGSLIL